MRTFVQLRQLIDTNKDLSMRLDALESRYDEQFKIVFEAIRQLMQPIKEPKRPIGFMIDSEKEKIQEDKTPHN